jgi:hypothetical protein
MSVLAPTLIHASNLSVAWGRALLHVFDGSKPSISPLVVSIGDFSSTLPAENDDVRSATDVALAENQLNLVRVTALTIFPYEIWCRRKRMDCKPFTELCLKKLLPRMKARNTQNRHGTYFERMMDFTGVKKVGEPRAVNQLLFVIDLLKNRTKWPRESALQISCFDPAKDHTGQPVRGFPCLQQIGIALDGKGNIALNAYYPTQYIFDRAYGNYLGLCQLGAFIAHETSLKFVRLTCFVGKPELGTVSKTRIEDLVKIVRANV